MIIVNSMSKEKLDRIADIVVFGRNGDQRFSQAMILERLKVVLNMLCGDKDETEKSETEVQASLNRITN